MHADSAFIRRLALVRDQGEAWSARFRSASARREGFGGTIVSILVAIPMLLLAGAALLVGLALAIALATLAIAVGLAVAAVRWLRRTLGLEGVSRGHREPEHPGRVNVRVIRRS